MSPKLTQEDSTGTVFLRSWAAPLIVAAICIPVIGLMLLSVLAVEGTALGLAAGALAVVALLVLAARLRTRDDVEIATHRDRDRRVLVLAGSELGPEEAELIAAQAGDADDVRLLVPTRGRRIDRWLSSTDEARGAAQDALARSAGALVAAGLPVSGSVGDPDPGQALEDELRSYPADEVIVLAGPGDEDPLGDAASRLRIPVSRVTAG